MSPESSAQQNWCKNAHLNFPIAHIFVYCVEDGKVYR